MTPPVRKANKAKKAEKPGNVARLAGKFIVIDGPDGAGKSTQLKLLAEYLRAAGLAVTEARDPGGTAIGDKIRHILLDRSHDEMVTGCEIMLYMASRAQLMGQVIGPALERGDCVLCDRWVSSTLVYQLAEGKATPKEVMNAYNVALLKTRPDLTIILDLPAEKGLSRLAGPPDRIEAKSLAFHKKVRELFLHQAKSLAFHKRVRDLFLHCAKAGPRAFAVVDASGSIQAVQERLRECLASWKFRR